MLPIIQALFCQTQHKSIESSTHIASTQKGYHDEISYLKPLLFLPMNVYKIFNIDLFDTILRPICHMQIQKFQ